MRKIRAILFFLFACSFGMFAQTDTCSYTIEGKVIDVETEEPIPYAFVKIRGVDRDTRTDNEGNFLIEGLCKDDNTLEVSCFGYCDSICTCHNQFETPNIYLSQKVIELGGITVKTQHEKEKGSETISQNTIEKEDLVDPTQSLASAVGELPGVTMKSTGTNVQLPVIHGLQGNRILILNNGLKHGFQNWGADHAPEIDVSSASKVTVIKGAAGVRFGPEALGGAIIVEPNPMLLDEPVHASIGTGFQTNGRGLFADFETSKGFKSWSYFLNGKVTKIGDRHTPDYSLTNSGKEEQSVSLGTRYQLNKIDAKVYYSYVNQNLALLRSSIAESGNAFVQAINSDEPTFIRPFSYDINEPNQLVQHHFGKAEINWWYSEEAKLTFRAGKQLNKRQEYDVRRNADKPIIDLDLVTSDYQLEWKHPDWFDLDGLLGVQTFNQDNDNNPGTGTTPLIPNYNTQRYSAFLIEGRKIKENTIELGVRLDYESNDVRGRETSQDVFRDNYDFTNLTSSIGYVRAFSDSTTFRTNLGTAWRTPNMNELYSFGQRGFKTTYGLLRYYTNEDGDLKTDRVTGIGESGVDPEKGYKFINEFQTRKKKSAYTVTVYSHYIENYIFDRPLAVIGTIRGPMPVFIYDQVDALFVGTDISWERKWTDQLTGTFGFSYLWSKNISENEPLINQPPMTTDYKLVWKQPNLWKFESSQLSVRPSYVFRQYQSPRTISPEDLIDGSVEVTSDSEVFDFKDEPNGYFLLDLAWSFKLKNFSGSVAVKNLLNTRYRDYLNELRYFADEQGRNLFITLNYSFKGKGNKGK